MTLSTPVTEVNWTGRSTVALEHPEGRILANRVIVTVPPSLVVAGKPSFKPALPAADMERFAKTPMGVFNKIAVDLMRDVFGDLPVIYLVNPLVDREDNPLVFVNLGLQRGDRMATGPSPRIHFAGEHVSKHSFSNVLGAYERASRRRWRRFDR